jgi:hypothetical protein
VGSPGSGPRTDLCGNSEEEECLAVVGLRPVQVVLSDPQAAVAATVTRMQVQQPSTPACTHGTVVNPPCTDTRHLITQTQRHQHAHTPVHSSSLVVLVGATRVL